MSKRQKSDRIWLSLLPVVISAVICILIKKHLGEIQYDVQKIDYSSVIDTMLTIWITLMGFVITAVSILIAFDGSEYTKEIRESGHYKTVMYMYLYTSFVLFIAICVFIPVNIISIWNMAILIILNFFIILSLELFLLCIIFLFLVLHTAK